jgi:hypothetical protein
MMRLSLAPDDGKRRSGLVPGRGGGFGGTFLGKKGDSRVKS